MRFSATVRRISRRAGGQLGHLFGTHRGPGNQSRGRSRSSAQASFTSSAHGPSPSRISTATPMAHVDARVKEVASLTRLLAHQHGHGRRCCCRNPRRRGQLAVRERSLRQASGAPARLVSRSQYVRRDARVGRQIGARSCAPLPKNAIRISTAPTAACSTCPARARSGSGTSSPSPSACTPALLESSSPRVS